MKYKRSYLKWISLTLLGYLVLSLLFSIYVERTYRFGLGHHLLSMGEESFRQTQQLESQLKSDPQLHEYWTVLRLTPPVGWIVRARLQYVEDRVIFASKNYALPEGERFSDQVECEHFGFDPNKKTDAEIRETLFTNVW